MKLISLEYRASNHIIAEDHPATIMFNNVSNYFCGIHSLKESANKSNIKYYIDDRKDYVQLLNNDRKVTHLPYFCILTATVYKILTRRLLYRIKNYICFFRVLLDSSLFMTN